MKVQHKILTWWGIAIIFPIVRKSRQTHEISDQNDLAFVPGFCCLLDREPAYLTCFS